MMKYKLQRRDTIAIAGMAKLYVGDLIAIGSVLFLYLLVARKIMGSDNTGSVSPDALRQAAKRWRDDHPDMFPLLVFFTNICVFHSASQRNTHITTTTTTTSIITIHDSPPLPSSLQRTLLGTTSSSSTFCMSRLLISLTCYPHTACKLGASPRT